MANVSFNGEQSFTDFKRQMPDLPPERPGPLVRLILSLKITSTVAGANRVLLAVALIIFGAAIGVFIWKYPQSGESRVGDEPGPAFDAETSVTNNIRLRR